MNVPKLRFPGFGDELKSRRIGDFAVVKTGSRDTQNRVDGGKYPFFARSDTIERINSFAFDGEAILTSGDGVGVGKNIHYINGKFDYHQRVYAIREFEAVVDGQFFFQFFRENFLRRVMRLSAKNSVDSVRMSMITDMIVATPSLAEQKKIAAFFLGGVDAKIAALRAREAGLERYKRGLMQALFSQTLRFTKPDGTAFPDWESTTFSDFAGLSKDRLNPVTSSEKPPLIELENLESGVGSIIGLSGLEGQLSQKNRFRFGDVLFGKLRPYLRKFARPNFDGVCSSEIWVLRGKTVSNAFLFYLIQGSQFNQLANISAGSKMPRSDWKTIADSEFEIPHPDEQQKIADARSAMDAKSAAVSDQVAQMEAFKKGLLQQMFVQGVNHG
ncbi:type I restriction enzyme, S subunit [Roseovarius lutimaris]|uniref:Type I restriction enzyme, S subunit n=1 Tax=Roseovarius lutimaris TaxID=1005928 RepID=A0A1I5BGR1_9RHOB|nr:restriction endonuclease subunit S [Roseovarius lutimaris]SFN73671.1 type I restriction enzyme, S subunit [Roseovarius lutimaris]